MTKIMAKVIEENIGFELHSWTLMFKILEALFSPTDYKYNIKTTSISCPAHRIAYGSSNRLNENPSKLKTLKLYNLKMTRHRARFCVPFGTCQHVHLSCTQQAHGCLSLLFRKTNSQRQKIMVLKPLYEYIENKEVDLVVVRSS